MFESQNTRDPLKERENMDSALYNLSCGQNATATGLLWQVNISTNRNYRQADTIFVLAVNSS